MIRFFSTIITVIILLTGCTRGKIFEKHIEFDDLSWNRFEVLEFEFEVDDVSVPYNILIAVRHIPEIPYEELEVGTIMTTPSGEVRALEHKVRVKDNEGNLLGDGMGDLWDLVEPLREDFQFNQPGMVSIELHNYMTRLETVGIIEVGLIVRKSDQ
jgi:gliding motility-associated lipoprotein GldH